MSWQEDLDQESIDKAKDIEAHPRLTLPEVGGAPVGIKVVGEPKGVSNETLAKKGIDTAWYLPVEKLGDSAKVVYDVVLPRSLRFHMAVGLKKAGKTEDQLVGTEWNIIAETADLAKYGESKVYRAQLIKNTQTGGGE